MAATYDLTTAVGQVRLKIGDTDVSPSTDAVFTDEELAFFLSANSNNINLSAADALDAWAAKYTANADTEKIGDYSYSQKISDKMSALAKRLRDTEISTPAGAYAEMGVTDFTYRDIIYKEELRNG